MAGQVAAFFQAGNQVYGGNVGALVQQLEEGVLAVDAGFAPDDGPGIRTDGCAVAGRLFAVAFHVELLDESGQVVQVLVVRGDDVAAAAEIVDVPNAYHAEQDGHVLFEGGVDEVLIHQVRAFEHCDEVFFAQVNHDGQADGGPQAVTAAHPIPKLKHIGRVYAEGGYGFFVGGNGNEVFGDIFFASGSQKPVAGGVGVGQGFLRGEGFGCDDEQGGFGADLFQNVAQLRAVHVGNEMHVQTRVAVGLQGGAHHQRALVGTADADIDDVGDGLAGIARPIAVADGMGKLPHMPEYGIDFGHNVFAVHINRRVGAVAQGDVQGGAVFGVVDFLSGKHGAHFFRQTAFACQLEQAVQSLVGDAVFGVVECQAADFEPVAAGSVGVLGEKVAHVHAFHFFIMRPQLPPCGQFGQVFHDVP